MIFLGIDGGQSSTTALIGDASGRVIGHGRGGPCNHVKIGDGRQKFIGAIMGCLEQAAPGQKLHFRSACLGFSGGPADKEAILQEIISADQMVLTNDGVIALTGATGGRPGVATIAGTGSFALGRNAEGKVARAGGWGYIYGDEGGAFDTTRQALRAILRHAEGWGPKTLLHDRLLAATGASDANTLLHLFYTDEWPRPRIATLAPLVDQAANDGDEVARKILDRQGTELAEMALAVHHQLFKSGHPVPMAYVGGVWRSQRVLQRFSWTVRQEAGTQVVAPLHGPAAGALLDAYRAAGLDVELSNVPTEKE